MIVQGFHYDSLGYSMRRNELSKGVGLEFEKFVVFVLSSHERRVVKDDENHPHIGNGWTLKFKFGEEADHQFVYALLCL